jgi:cytochrome c biogenesis protein CcmG, thiol:disulfide interchange protein DsbE
MDETTTGPARPRRMSGRSAAMLAVAVVAVSAIGGILVLTAGSSPAKTSSHAPVAAKPFSLAELGDPGHTLSLAGLAGKPVIINFFASWCAPCKHETPMLAQFYRAHDGKVLVIGVDSNDQASAALKFVKAEGVSYPVASDPTATVAVRYGVFGLPQTFFLNAQHKIVRHVIGDLTQAELTARAASLGRHQAA